MAPSGCPPAAGGVADRSAEPQQKCAVIERALKGAGDSGFDDSLFADLLKFCETEIMTTIVTINERGTLTLPKEIRKKLGVAKAGQVLLDCDEAGQVVLRPCATFPIEIYTEKRLAEFQESEAALEPLMPRIRAALSKAQPTRTKVR